MKLTPYIIGSGRAAQAIEKSLACLRITDPARERDLEGVVRLPRGAPLAELPRGDGKRILFIANPPGLHARAILEAEAAGFDAVACEKPVCVSLEDAQRLEDVRIPVAVFHVYRQTWGVATLRELIRNGALGTLVSIEGRYWQASTAERVLAGSTQESARNWKNDATLSGPSDTLLDVGTHWVDAVCHLQGALPERIALWRSFAGAETPHRDTHVQLALDFPQGGRAFGSISKIVHGATNHFELNLLGTRGSATWTFLDPDTVRLGEGKETRTLVRKDAERGSRQMPFHGLGWLEGYVEITRRLLARVAGDVGTEAESAEGEFPNLAQTLPVLKALISAAGA